MHIWRKLIMTDLFKEMLEGDLFMQCDVVNRVAFRSLPKGFSLRLCRHNEITTWKAIFAQGKYMDFVDSYYNKVYAPFEEEFFRRCLFVVDECDKPIATSGIWRSYGMINTLLGFFVIPEYEGQGIGRGLLSEVMRNVDEPVYLHTHPTANKAIKLYSDFGFKFVIDSTVGYRKNILEKAYLYLRELLSKKGYSDLPTIKANPALLEAALLDEFAEF